MIFQHTWRQVLDGSKTQTRRLVKPGDHLGHWHGIPAVLSASGRPRWRVGQEIAVQPGRGERAVGRVRVEALWRADVRQVSDEDAHAEGFASRADFWTLWVMLHDPAFARSLAREGAAVGQRIDALMARPSKHYDAWALQFQLIPDRAGQSRR